MQFYITQYPTEVAPTTCPPPTHDLFH